MTIGVNADKSAYSCNIARPSGTTYLFFESYEIKVEGGSIEHYGGLPNSLSDYRNPNHNSRGVW